MITVGELLQGKGNDIWSMKPDDPLRKGLKLMAEKDLSALLEMEGKIAQVFFCKFLQIIPVAC